MPFECGMSNSRTVMYALRNRYGKLPMRILAHSGEA